MIDNIIQSAGGIVYYREKDWTIKFLLIKRLARSSKIERVAPKWKIQKWEKMEDAVLREVSEEAGIPINKMKLKQKIGKTQLRNTENIRWHMNKDVTYFLVEYTWNPSDVQVDEVEWYTGIYKRSTIHDVLKLVYYKDIRELIRDSYMILKDASEKNAIKQDFMRKLDI